MTGIRSLSFRIVRRATNTLLCVTVLIYCASFLMHDSALVRNLLPGGRGILRIDSVEAMDAKPMDSRNSTFQVEGSAPPAAWIEIGFGNRVLKGIMAGSDGRFRFSAELPPQAHKVWVRLMEGRNEKTGGTTADVPRAAGLKPAFALAMTDVGLIWLAGESRPDQIYRIEYSGDSLSGHRASADGDGILDVLLPFAGPLPEEIVIRDEIADSVYGTPVSCKVIKTRLDSVPLARRVSVSLSDSALREVFSVAGRREEVLGDESFSGMLELLETNGSVVRYEIDLPAAHPIVSAYSLGLLEQEAVLAKTWGDLGGEILRFDRFHQVLGRALHVGEGELQRVLKPKLHLLRTDSGFVTLAGEFMLIVGGELLISGAGTQSIGSRLVSIGSLPLLGPGDRLVVRLNGRRLEWLSEPLPGKSDEARLEWSGIGAAAARTLPPVQKFAMGFPKQYRFSALGATRENLRASGGAVDSGFGKDDLARFEERGAETFKARYWRLLLAFVPFAWAFWLIGREMERDPKRDPAMWRPVLGMGIVFAVWTCRDMFGLVREGLSRLPLLGDFTGMVFYIVSASQSISVADHPLWITLGRSVDWVLFLSLIGLVPLYFKALSGDVARAFEAQQMRKSLLLQCLRFAVMTIFLGWATLHFTAVDLLERAYHWMGLGDFSRTLAAGMGTESALRIYAPWLGVVLLGLAFCAWGLAGLSFGIGQVCLLLHGMRPRTLWLQPDPEFPEAVQSLIEALQAVPSWIILVATGFASFFLVRRLFSEVLPFPTRRALNASGVLMILVFLAFPFLTPRMSLQAASVLLFIGLAWTLFQGLPSPTMLSGPFAVRPLSVLLVVGGAVLAALLVGWPAAKNDSELDIWQVGQLVDRLEGLLPYFLGFGILIRLRHLAPPGKVALHESNLDFGIFLFAALLVGLSTTYLWLPIPFLVALALARYRLFRPAAEVSKSGEADLSDAGDLREFLRQAMKHALARARLRTALDHLDGKLAKLETTPLEYAAKRNALKAHFEERPGKPLPESEDVSLPNPGAPWVFSVGGPDAHSNLVASLKVGALLSAIPILIGIYQNLPTRSFSFPYPLADFLIYLATALLYWLLLIAFFGFFYPYLRGRTGLGKGVGFSLLLVIPHLAQRFLSAQGLQDMRPFLLWSSQLLLFLSLLGLLAGDWRLLRSSGLRARNLLLVHNLPVLSAYASAVMAALVTSVAGLLSDQMKELFGFFLDNFVRN